jgi:hypothetical protein
MLYKPKLFCVFGAVTLAAAQEYNAETKTLKFPLTQVSGVTFNTTSAVSELDSYSGSWQIGLEFTVGDGNKRPYIVLNDNSTPVMTVDTDAGCVTCTNGPSGTWYIGDA